MSPTQSFALRRTGKSERDDVGARIAAARKAAGLSQRQVAEMLGVPPRTFSYYESAAGDRHVVLCWLCQSLSVEPILEALDHAHDFIELRCFVEKHGVLHSFIVRSRVNELLRRRHKPQCSRLKRSIERPRVLAAYAPVGCRRIASRPFSALAIASVSGDLTQIMVCFCVKCKCMFRLEKPLQYF